VLAAIPASADDEAFTANFTTPAKLIAPTVPQNGDQNPHGVAVVQKPLGVVATQKMKGAVSTTSPGAIFSRRASFIGPGTAPTIKFEAW